MTKLIRKFRPFDYSYIREMESWLSHMSEQGLHVQKIGARLVTFEKGEPKRVAYHLALTIEKELKMEEHAFYEENGWEYIASYQYYHVLKATESAAAVQVDATIFPPLKKKLRANIYFPLVAIFIYTLLLAALWLLDGTPILRMVEGAVISQTLLGVVLLSNLIDPVQAFRNIRRFEETIHTKTMLHQHVDWQARKKIHQIRTVSFVMFALCAAALPFMQLIKSDYGEVRAAELDVPFIQLDELMQGKHTQGEEELDWYSTQWSVFAPVQYEVYQSGDGEENYVSVETKVYKLSIEALAPPLLNDLKKWYTYEGAPAFQANNSAAMFDELIVREASDRKELIARMGRVVLFARYEGEGEMDGLVERAAQVMREVSEGDF